MLKANKPKLVKRLKIINGQVTAVSKMLEENRYCVDTIRLSLAIQKSLQSFNQELLKNHLEEHVKNQFAKGQSKKAIAELSEIYKLTNK